MIADPKTPSPLEDLDLLHSQAMSYGCECPIGWDATEAWRRLRAALESVPTLTVEVEELREENDRLRQDRLDYSHTTTTEGMNASEWIWRTGRAEREADALRALARQLGEALERARERCSQMECSMTDSQGYFAHVRRLQWDAGCEKSCINRTLAAFEQAKKEGLL
jgi:hypothetical protein